MKTLCTIVAIAYIGGAELHFLFHWIHNRMFSDVDLYINPCYCLIPVELLNNLNVRIPGYPMILFPHGADKN